MEGRIRSLTASLAAATAQSASLEEELKVAASLASTAEVRGATLAATIDRLEQSLILRQREVDLAQTALATRTKERDVLARDGEKVIAAKLSELTAAAECEKAESHAQAMQSEARHQQLRDDEKAVATARSRSLEREANAAALDTELALRETAVREREHQLNRRPAGACGGDSSTFELKLAAQGIQIHNT